MTLKDFADLTQIIQSLLISIGVISGGVWALYRFKNLKELDKAKIELETLKQSLEKHGHLNIEIATQEIGVHNKGEKLIKTSVMVSNIGNHTEVLNWTEGGGITFSRIVGFSDKNIQLEDWHDVKLIGWRGERNTSSISPGNKKIFNFILPINQPGHYYVMFKVEGSKTETEFYETGIKNQSNINRELLGPTLWSAETFIVVN